MPKKLKQEKYKGITVSNIEARLLNIKSWMNPEKEYELSLSRNSRSVEISTRFHGHVTYISRQLALDRNYCYYMILLKAIVIEADGGSPYPAVVVPVKKLNPISMRMETIDLPVPLRTKNRTNKEMITACFAAELYWSENGEGLLPEKYDAYGRVDQ